MENFQRYFLMFSILIFSYFLLIRWDPQENNYNEELVYNDSERSLSEPLAPLSQANQGQVEVASDELDYFEIQNNDLSLMVESRTGRFEVSSLKNITEEKGSEERFSIFGRTYDASSGRENVYFANSGFYTRTQGYLNPEFDQTSKFDKPPK